MNWFLGLSSRSDREELVTDELDDLYQDDEQKATFIDLLKITKGYRRVLLLALFTSLVGALLSLAQPLLASRTVEEFPNGTQVGLWLTLLAVVFLGEAIITGIGHYLLERTGEQIVLGIRTTLVGRLLRWPINRYQHYRLGDLLTRSTTDTAMLRNTLAYDLVEVGVGSVFIIGGITMMVWLDPMMFLIVLGILGVIGGLTTLLLAGIRRSAADAQDSLGAMNAELERALSAIRTIRVMRAEQREHQRIAQFAQDAYDNAIKALKRDAIIEPAMTLATHSTTIVVLVVGGFRVAHGEMTLGDLVAFLLYVTYIASPVANIFDLLATLQHGLASLQRIHDVTSIELEATTPVTPPSQIAEQGRVGRTPALEFNKVSFSYEADRQVLQQVSFEVWPQTYVALVGSSGSGKSTVFSLIARFFDPTAGNVYLDGKDIVSELSIKSCREQIGLVEQSAPLMYGTLRENITYALPEATEAEINRVIKLASLEELIARLPHGLETLIGEHGNTVSGGERQRIAIARALLPRPKLLLLDEPTAHLDASNAAKLNHTFTKIKSECTLLVIAHQDAAIEAADKIITLESGRVQTVSS